MCGVIAEKKCLKKCVSHARLKKKLNKFFEIKKTEKCFSNSKI